MFKKEKKLHLGCGTNIVKGWINVDILKHKGIVRHDLRKPLPFKDNEFHKIVHEHFIEHLEKEDGHRLLQECYRVLKPGGVMRVGWPDMQRMLDAHQKHNNTYRNYVKDHILFSVWKGDNWDEFLSDCLFSWDHRYNYTRNHMRALLEHIGFTKVVQKKYMQSDYGFDIDVRNDPATTYFEAMK